MSCGLKPAPMFERITGTRRARAVGASACCALRCLDASPTAPPPPDRRRAAYRYPPPAADTFGRRPLLSLGSQRAEHFVLLQEVTLDLQALVQDSLGVVVGLLGTLVRSASLHPLADHDH